MRSWIRGALLGACVANLAVGCQLPGELEDSDAARVVVGNDVLREADGKVSDVSTIAVEGSSVRITTWKETAHGVTSPYYAINLGKGWHAAKKTSYEVPLRARRIDPTLEVASRDLRDAGTGLHIVQYVAQPLEAFSNAIEGAGGEVHQYLHGNAQIVRGDVRAIERISKLSFVRAVTPMTDSDRIEPALANVADIAGDAGVVIVLVDPARDRSVVEDRIVAMGGRITVSDPEGILIEAQVSAREVTKLAGLSEVLWIEQGRPNGVDYDIANQQGGADYLQALPASPLAELNYTGMGIRGHIMEGINPAHPDLAATDYRTAPVGIDNVTADSHGMQTFGIVFGSGAGNPRARGLLPNGQGFFTNSAAVTSAPKGGRSTLVGKLINEHKVMFQTASWGGSLVRTYTAFSAEMDALILKHDLPITQSQSNAGNQDSRPQAWAKNIISVGAVNHYGTASATDDKWGESGSIGPAADGSLKPDLCFYYDKTITTTLNGYSNNFGGTSGATPTVAGHVGLTIELWTNGVFGNPLIAREDGEELASYRFKNRPHFTTTKALLIHSAKQYAFEGASHDLTRTHQGWGVPDLEGMYRRRTNMLVVNETDVLQNLERKAYTIQVPPGAPDVRATLVYADKEAAVPGTIHRVNNLDLKVTAPDGTIYWGNNGLRTATTSTPGGEHDTLNTVENVFVRAPAAGKWTVEVIADELNADTHVATKAVDSSYALVVSAAPLKQ